MKLSQRKRIAKQKKLCKWLLLTSSVVLTGVTVSTNVESIQVFANTAATNVWKLVSSTKFDNKDEVVSKEQIKQESQKALASVAAVWKARTLEETKAEIKRQKDLGLSHYVIQWGDTLGVISLATEQDENELAKLNGLDDKNKILTGDVLQGVLNKEVTTKSVATSADVAAKEKDAMTNSVATTNPAVPSTAKDNTTQPSTKPVEKPKGATTDAKDNTATKPNGSTSVTKEEPKDVTKEEPKEEPKDNSSSDNSDKGSDATSSTSVTEEPKGDESNEPSEEPKEEPKDNQGSDKQEEPQTNDSDDNTTDLTDVTEPTVEEPKVDEPTVEEPTVEDPKTDDLINGFTKAELDAIYNQAKEDWENYLVGNGEFVTGEEIDQMVNHLEGIKEGRVKEYQDFMHGLKDGVEIRKADKDEPTEPNGLPDGAAPMIDGLPFAFVDTNGAFAYGPRYFANADLAYEDRNNAGFKCIDLRIGSFFETTSSDGIGVDVYYMTKAK